jgi:hypothetical protein
MIEFKNEVIRNVLDTFSKFNPAFRINGRRLLIMNREKALNSLRHHSLDLLAFSACDIEDNVRSILSEGWIKETVFQVRLLKELEKVFDILSGENIPVAVIKGFALKRYYPRDSLRPFSDIDIIIPPDEKYKCKGP